MLRLSRPHVKALQATRNLGMASHLVLHAPLIWVDKPATWTLSEKLGGLPLVELIRVRIHTCCRGVHDELHPRGYGCGNCPACKLSQRGWEACEVGWDSRAHTDLAFTKKAVRSASG